MRKFMLFVFAMMLSVVSGSGFANDLDGSSEDSGRAFQHYTQFSMAGNFVQLVDELVIPVRHQGASGEVFINYMAEDSVDKWNIGMQFGYGDANSRIGTDADLYNAYVNISWARHAAYLGNLEEVSLFAGAFIQAGGKYQFYPEIDESHLYWIMQYALGLHLDFELPMQQDRRFNWRIRLPIVSGLSRPLNNQLYNNDESDIALMLQRMNENITLVFPNQYLMLESLLTFEYRLSKTWKQHIGYKFEYEQNNDSAKFQQIKHGLFFGVSAVW